DREVGKPRFEREVVDHLENHDWLHAYSDTWDVDPELCGAPGGMHFNLRAGILKPNQADHRLTMKLGVQPRPGNFPKIQAFLEKIQPDREKREYIFDCVAVWASGAVHWERYWMFIGTGANGKSVLLGLISRALGDYATRSQKDLVIKSYQ